MTGRTPLVFQLESSPAVQGKGAREGVEVIPPSGEPVGAVGAESDQEDSEVASPSSGAPHSNQFESVRQEDLGAILLSAVTGGSLVDVRYVDHSAVGLEAGEFCRGRALERRGLPLLDDLIRAAK